MKKVVWCLWLVLAMPSMALSAENTDADTANFIMQGCRNALSGEANKITLFDAGLCARAVNAIAFAGGVECAVLKKGYVTPGQDPGVDIPDDFTTEEAIRIVVKYIDARPERMNELFYGLAREALAQAWPCKH